MTLAVAAVIVMSGSLSVQAAKAGKVENRTIIYGGHTYQIFDKTMNWEGANAFCEHLGGHLVTITKSGEQKAIQKLCKKGKKNFYWIGLKLNSANSYSKWITGEKVQYQKWSGQDPNNYAGDEVVYTIQYQLNGGTQARNQIYTYDSSSAVTPGIPKRSGYQFAGWYTDKYFTNKVSEIAAGSNKNYVLYARWKKK